MRTDWAGWAFGKVRLDPEGPSGHGKMNETLGLHLCPDAVTQCVCMHACACVCTNCSIIIDDILCKSGCYYQVPGGVTYSASSSTLSLLG